jgi:hypothetical protein
MFVFVIIRLTVRMYGNCGGKQETSSKGYKRRSQGAECKNGGLSVNTPKATQLRTHPYAAPATLIFSIFITKHQLKNGFTFA